MKEAIELVGEIYEESGKVDPNWAIIQGNARKTLSLLRAKLPAGEFTKALRKLCDAERQEPDPFVGIAEVYEACDLLDQFEQELSRISPTTE